MRLMNGRNFTFQEKFGAMSFWLLNLWPGIPIIDNPPLCSGFSYACCVCADANKRDYPLNVRNSGPQNKVNR